MRDTWVAFIYVAPMQGGPLEDVFEGAFAHAVAVAPKKADAEAIWRGNACGDGLVIENFEWVSQRGDLDEDLQEGLADLLDSVEEGESAWTELEGHGSITVPIDEHATALRFATDERAVLIRDALAAGKEGEAISLLLDRDSFRAEFQMSAGTDLRASLLESGAREDCVLLRDTHPQRSELLFDEALQEIESRPEKRLLVGNPGICAYLEYEPGQSILLTRPDLLAIIDGST